jgi:stage V sporulation protein G
MEITEVRVAVRESGEKRLKAYATVTFDNCFVVRNIKIIEGKNGLFVAMPSRKPKVTCGKCAFKGELGHRFCTQCGAHMPRPMGPTDVETTEASSHRDIAHPITAEFRQYVQQKILDAYEAERAKSHSPPASSVAMDYETV